MKMQTTPFSILHSPFAFAQQSTSHLPFLPLVVGYVLCVLSCLLVSEFAFVCVYCCCLYLLLLLFIYYCCYYYYLFIYLFLMWMAMVVAVAMPMPMSTSTGNCSRLHLCQALIYFAASPVMVSLEDAIAVSISWPSACLGTVLKIPISSFFHQATCRQLFWALRSQGQHGECSYTNLSGRGKPMLTPMRTADRASIWGRSYIRHP